MAAIKSAVKMSAPLLSAKSMAKFPRFSVPLTSISTKTASIRLIPRLILAVQGGQSGIPEEHFRTPQEFEFPSVSGNRPSISPPEFPRSTTRTPEMDPAGDTPPEFSPDPPVPEFVPNPGTDFPAPPLQPPDGPDIPAPLQPPQDPPDIPIPPRPQQPPDIDPPISTPPDIVPPPPMPPGIEPPTGTTIM